MDPDTWCDAYNNLGDPAMETFLYHSEYAPYNLDADGGHQLDDHIYYKVLDCNLI